MRRVFLITLAVIAAYFIDISAAGAQEENGSASSDHLGMHGEGHAEGHDIYKHWSPPNNPNTSCCNNGDCRPTRAYVDSEGRWRAWNGNLWLVVPKERVLPPDLAGDGRSHLCEKEQFIYCFTPGEIRS